MQKALLAAENGLLITTPGQEVIPVKASELKKHIPESDDILIVFDYKKLLECVPEMNDIPFRNIFDVKLACYVKNPTSDCSSLAGCARQYAISYDDDSIDNQSRCLLELYNLLAAEMQNNRVFNELEMPLAPVLFAMEKRGIALDAGSLQIFGQQLTTELATLEQSIHELAGRQFNINSPKQLGEVLFDHLQLTAMGKKTKSGYSTDAETLEKMLDQHPVIGLILKYRKLAKLNSTYVEGLLKAQQSDGRIHTTFNMTATATGRLSSTEPNLQNLPVRSELGGEIRKFLHSAPGWVLIDADYSQIELRLLAVIAQDPVMLDAFRNHEDIHAVTARQIFKVDAEAVTPEMRRRAKAVNFGIVYGISAFALANDLKISREEAQNYIASYFEKYSAIKSFLDNTVKNAHADGYVETLWKRRRYLPELKNKSFAVRSFGERAALNMPIQGTAADLIKAAMIAVDENLRRAQIPGGLLLQIHDELLITVPEEFTTQAADILKNTMENVLSLSIPLEVSLAVGLTYADVK